MPDINIDNLSLRVGQQGQILDEYRFNMYNQELKTSLLIKMMEEKGIFITGEFEKRWPLFLKNDVGVIGPDGIMEGTLRRTFYGL